MLKLIGRKEVFVNAACVLWTGVKPIAINLSGTGLFKQLYSFVHTNKYVLNLKITADNTTFIIL